MEMVNFAYKVPQGIINLMKNLFTFDNHIDKVVEKTYDMCACHLDDMKRQMIEVEVNSCLEDDIDYSTIEDVIKYFHKFEPNHILKIDDGTISVYDKREENDFDWAARLYRSYFKYGDIELSNQKKTKQSLQKEKVKLLKRLKEIDNELR